MYSLCGQTYTERKGSFLSLVPSRQLACDTEVVTIQITGRMWHFLFNQWFWITSYIDHCFLSLLWFVIKRVRLLMCSWPLPSLWWRTHVHSYFSSPLEFFLQVRKPCSVELKSWVMMTCPFNLSRFQYPCVWEGEYLGTFSPFKCVPQFNFARTFLNSFVACFLGLTNLLHLLANCLRAVWIDWLCVCRVCFDCESH